MIGEKLGKISQLDFNGFSSTSSRRGRTGAVRITLLRDDKAPARFVTLNTLLCVTYVFPSLIVISCSIYYSI